MKGKLGSCAKMLPPQVVTKFVEPVIPPGVKARRVMHLSIDQPGMVWVYLTNHNVIRFPVALLPDIIGDQVICKIRQFGKREVHGDTVIQWVHLVGFEQELKVVISKGWRDLSALCVEDSTMFDFEILEGDWRQHQFIVARLDLF